MTERKGQCRSACPPQGRCDSGTSRWQRSGFQPELDTEDCARICEILNREHAHVHCVIGGEVICLSHSGGFRPLIARMACVPESGFAEQATIRALRASAGCEIHGITGRAQACHHPAFSTPRGHRDFVIGTGNYADLSASPSDDVTSEEAKRVPEKSHRRPWLLIDSDEGVGDFAGVFQRQWRHACRVA
ncbi:MAG: hypothetical protein GY878_13335 [Fuerstiella sp.]|nr:hypothetical protein [Fuerstiella sp.]